MFPCAPFFDIQALKHEFPNLYFPAVVKALHIYFGHIANLTTAYQFWRKLLVFLRKATYFILVNEIWIPYGQNSIFSFVEFPYVGKKLATYAEEMPTTIYINMETLKSWS